MPTTLPSPNLDLANYPASIAAQLQTLYLQGDTVLTLPIGFALADAAVLYTVPTGVRLMAVRLFYEVTTPFTGGASSAIGISSTNAAYSTKGDLCGGASGDVLAGLTAGFRGTIGTKLASNGLVVLAAGDVVRFDRITSAFTAGAGLVHFLCQLLPTS